MKILQIISVPVTYPGGTEKVVFEISKRLSKKHDVTILQTTLYQEKEKFKKSSFIDGIKIITCKNDYYLGGYGYSKDFKKILKKIWKNYDIIHIHGYARFTSNFALKFLYKKKPVIFSPHGFIHTKKNYLFKIIHDLTIGKFIRYAKFCTALTKLDYKYYKKLDVKKEKIIELPNGVDIEKINKIKKEDVEKFKRKYRLKNNTLLFVGRIHKSKGLQYVIKAIKDIDCKFLIVGKDTGYKEGLLKIIKENKVENKILFTGPLNEKEVLMAYLSCDVFVLFSEWEGFGIVIIEAMASGKPVIVSDKGSLPFLVKQDRNGLVIPFKNVGLLNKELKSLFGNKDKMKKIGLNGKKFSKDYKWEKIIKKYIQIYKKIK